MEKEVESRWVERAGREEEDEDEEIEGCRSENFLTCFQGKNNKVTRCELEGAIPLSIQ